jgi:hypothetical protein
METPSVFVKEELLHYFGAADKEVTQSCCLCDEGTRIQKELVEHLGSKHSQGEKHFKNSLSTNFNQCTIFRFLLLLPRRL